MVGNLIINGIKIFCYGALSVLIYNGLILFTPLVQWPGETAIGCLILWFYLIGRR